MILKPKFTFKENYCDCHPETCCCDDYIIMMGDVKVGTLSDYERVKEVLEILNKE